MAVSCLDYAALIAKALVGKKEFVSRFGSQADAAVGIDDVCLKLERSKGLNPITRLAS